MLGLVKFAIRYTKLEKIIVDVHEEKIKSLIKLILIDGH